MALALCLDVDAPFAELEERARNAEALGFQTVYVPDHSRPWRHDPVPGGLWFDGWTVLAALAAATSTVRLGPLVANPVLRPPDLLVREALALDHLSGGRLQLGMGTGIAGFDHEAPPSLTGRCPNGWTGSGSTCASSTRPCGRGDRTTRPQPSTPGD